jgi:hypothetical protein
MVPYTTYQANYYSIPVVYGYAAVPSCGPSPCATGGCGVTYGAPSSGCSSCQVGSTVTQPPAEYANPPAAPSTFKETKAPVKEEPPKKNDVQQAPAPVTKPSSTVPAIHDPNDRSASRGVILSARVEPVSHPIPQKRVAVDSGWYPSKD